MQRRSHGNDRDRKWGKALSRRVAARQDDWGQDGPATDTRLLGAPVRTSTLALIVAAAALLASVGVATGKAHGAKHPQLAERSTCVSWPRRSGFTDSRLCA